MSFLNRPDILAIREKLARFAEDTGAAIGENPSAALGQFRSDRAQQSGDVNNLLRAQQDPQYAARLGLPIDQLPTYEGGPTAFVPRIPQTPQFMLAQHLQKALQDPSTARELLGITPSPQEAAGRLRATLEAMQGIGMPGNTGAPGSGGAGGGGAFGGLLAGMRPQISIDPQTGKSRVSFTSQDMSGTEFSTKEEADLALNILQQGGGNGTISRQPTGIYRLSVLVPALSGGATGRGGNKGAPTEQQVRMTLEKMRTAFAADPALAQSSVHRSIWNAYAGLVGDVPQIEEILNAEGVFDPAMELDWIASREIEAALDSDVLADAPARAKSPQGAGLPTSNTQTPTTVR